METVCDAFFDVLRKLNLHDVRQPGIGRRTRLRDFPDDFRDVPGLQEATVIATADGHARSTGRRALAQVHTAAGLGNAMGNIASAWHNRAPLIVPAGQQTREMLLPAGGRRYREARWRSPTLDRCAKGTGTSG
ncbi:thiamine pyrophosphate-binding protein [Nakamurella sp. PAMC28650]|uniref:thiamine pyrophosphate-binding protein n=1 Tax=Nakamurella sp. PAMC28650 TaxID=2762325 RepID=UPI00164E4439|nr:hypothetical protein H7F38_03825 [Nakamurella sp. PAMC28650]